jgi:hypothetical protein
LIFNNFYWYVADANENAIKSLLNIDKLPTLIKYNLERIKPGWGIRYTFLIKSNKPISYEIDDKKITCGTSLFLQFDTKTPNENNRAELVYSETEFNWVEFNWESTNLKINLAKDFIYYTIVGIDKFNYFKCIEGKHKKINLKEFNLLNESLPKHLKP